MGPNLLDEMGPFLVKFPDVPFAAHHLLLKAALQRLQMDHARLLVAHPVFSISEAKSHSVTGVKPNFFVRYFRTTLGESSAEVP